MPGGFPIGQEICNGQYASAIQTGSTGILVASSATINTKGSWVQLIASTSYDACAVLVSLNGFPGTHTCTWLVDIGIGASGSEQVIVSNLMLQSVGAGAGVAQVFFPLAIPAGTRISARSQSTAASNSVAVDVDLFDGAFTQMEGAAGVDAIGVSTSTSLGTALTAGAANTKGSYAQLTAATSRDYIGFFGIIDLQNSTAANQDCWLFDIAIGASGSEQVIIPNIDLSALTVSGFPATYFPVTIPFFPIPIPSGTRIAARTQSGVGSNTFGLSLYGVYK